MTKKGLTPKQEAFVLAYLSNGRNACAAYRAAYTATRMSDKAVNKEAQLLLKHPLIAPRLVELREKTVQRLQVTSDDVTLSAHRAMMANLKRTLDENGKPMPMKDWPDDLMLAVDSYEHTKETDPQGYTTEKVKVKIASRTIARDQLAKHLGWYKVDNAQKNPWSGMTLERLKAIERVIDAAESNPGPVVGDPAMDIHRAPGSTH